MAETSVGLAAAARTVAAAARAEGAGTRPGRRSSWSRTRTGIEVATGCGRVHFPVPRPRSRRIPSREFDVACRGRARSTVTARTLVRDLLLQADRLAPAATADRGLVTLLPGEEVTIGVRGWETPDAERRTSGPVLRGARADDGIAGPPRHHQGRRRARRCVQGGGVARLQPQAGAVRGDPGPDLRRPPGSWAGRRTSRPRSLSGSRVDVVGLAICRPARLLGLEPFYMEFISGVESVLTEHSCSLLLRLVRSVEEEVGLQDAWWRGRQVAGRSWSTSARTIRGCRRCERLGMPVVAVGHPSLTGGLTSVWTDDATAVTEAVRYLAALGHRRIARVGGRGGARAYVDPYGRVRRGGPGRSGWPGPGRWPRTSRGRRGRGRRGRCSAPPARTGRRRSCTTTTSWRWRGWRWPRRWG